MLVAKNNQVTLTINETDEVNTPLATFVYSETIIPTTELPFLSNKKSRVDILPPRLSASSSSSLDQLTSTSVINSCISYLMHVFLPVGYPHSVSKDYLGYQIYDSIQAFSSSIAGLLSSRAVLQGVGVGDAAASPTSALLLQILQDTSGRIATILFAHRLGTALEPECKMYRLAADVFNDIAMILDCLSPLVTPRAARVAVISGAGVLRALCGVAAGSSKASLSAHFARWGNIGELNAKDSSQETIISLLGMLAGSIVVSHVTSLPATWISLIVLLIIHLATNYRAVRAVQMTTLNRQRANIVFSTIFERDQVPTESTTSLNQHKQQSVPPEALRPDEVAHHERIFERDGILRWTAISSSRHSTNQNLGWCRIGVSVQELISSLPISTNMLPDLLKLFSSEAYIVCLNTLPASPTTKKSKQKPRIFIVLKHGCTPTQQLKAWAHALLAARTVLSLKAGYGNEHTMETPETQILEVLSCSLAFLNSRFDTYYVSELKRAGWDLETAALETRPGRRISIVES
ncbi:vitamin B6 photo-protection and homoeostasis-domain-containing protein [Talaromyces proteolyticus]|uniref:Vitamin B6 photo-protection and homoeostasis-domain-containing protein n=1 Tax=Talaromyces proteolyticus TaxID=1131652 RepID=A0AAD4KQL5_9EURO|nr:vitamin B6 photo-protection and homoeostasis-domain-containing protein [Talaromyces proteolyticus]KAH8697175.1 vitamin B6 photo-protection and homoeostasis-domain-containing protein [Talaromyces proteolyticus]